MENGERTLTLIDVSKTKSLCIVAVLFRFSVKLQTVKYISYSLTACPRSPDGKMTWTCQHNVLLEANYMNCMWDWYIKSLLD